MAGVTKEELLAAIEDDFQDACVDDAKVQKLLEKMANGTAGYDEVQAYSKRIGQLLSKSFNKHVTAEALPDGLTLEMAQTAIQKPLIETYDMAAKAAVKYVEAQNTKAGIGIKPKLPEHNPHKVENFVEKVSDKPLDKIGWMLDEPVVNHTMSAVDDTVKVNADVQTKLGLNVTITRSTVGKSTCNWCRNLAGTYHYNDVNQGGHDVWKRHAHCDCKIEYISDKDTHAVNNYVKGNQTERQRREIEKRKAQHKPDDRAKDLVEERKDFLTLENNGEHRRAREVEKPSIQQASRHKNYEGFNNLLEESRQIGVLLDSIHVEHRDVKKHDRKLSEDDIVARLAGVDPTVGSCVSQALCYIGQKAGLDVVDFRGGASREFFSSRDRAKALVEMFTGNKAIYSRGANASAAAMRSFWKLEVGKEYYFSAGTHAAIVRRVSKDRYQYLELQSEDFRGWCDFPEQSRLTFVKRFGCDKDCKRQDSCIIEIGDVKRSDDLEYVLGYINNA